MRATIICFIIIIMVLVTTNLNAVEPFNAFWKSRQSRQQEARDWRDGFMKLNEQIPTLSPAEKHWLKTEIDDEIDRAEQHYTKRAHDAMNSREFDLRMAKPHVEEIMRVLSDLSRPTILDQRTEVILWAKLASLFMDYEFW